MMLLYTGIFLGYDCKIKEESVGYIDSITKPDTIWQWYRSGNQIIRSLILLSPYISMTCRRDPEAAEREAWLQEAITAVLNGQFSCYRTAQHFDVPERTLYGCIKGGKKPRNQAHEHDQILTHVEKKELIQWITCLMITGYPPHYQTLCETVEEIRRRCVEKINEIDMILVEYSL